MIVGFRTLLIIGSKFGCGAISVVELALWGARRERLFGGDISPVRLPEVSPPYLELADRNGKGCWRLTSLVPTRHGHGHLMTKPINH